jgi:hypothetical protein
MALVVTDVSEVCIASIISAVRSEIQLLVTISVDPSLLILSTLMTVAKRSSGSSVLIRTTRCNIPEDGNLRSHSREKPQILHSINRLGCVA